MRAIYYHTALIQSFATLQASELAISATQIVDKEEDDYDWDEAVSPLPKSGTKLLSQAGSMVKMDSGSWEGTGGGHGKETGDNASDWNENSPLHSL